MAVWEFLLQQEGDYDWLPLESPVVEVLEGRYCLMARSQSANTSIKIQVAFEDEEAGDAKGLHSGHTAGGGVGRSWERMTDPEGLLLILPFTYLKPGQWKTCCRIVDQVTDPIVHEMCLEVMATESNVKEPWSDLDLYSAELSASQRVQDQFEDEDLADLSPLSEDLTTPEIDPTFILIYGGSSASEKQIEVEQPVEIHEPAEIEELVKIEQSSEAEERVEVDQRDETEVSAIAPIPVEPVREPEQPRWFGELGLELFDLVKNPHYFQPFPFTAHMDWVNPPQLSDRDRTVIDPEDPWLAILQLPFFKPYTWIDLDSTQVPQDVIPVEERPKAPISSAQVLTQLVRASQTEVRSPSFSIVSGGRAANQKRFHAKLTELVQASGKNDFGDRPHEI